MKKTTNNAEYILLKAYHPVDWDKNGFVIVKITNEWCDLMKKRLDTLVPFTYDKLFYNHCYYHEGEGYFIDFGYKHLPDEIIAEDELWCFVQLEEKDVQDLFKNENIFFIYQVIIDRFQEMWLKGCHADVEVEFHTQNFEVAELFPNKDLAG